MQLKFVYGIFPVFIFTVSQNFMDHIPFVGKGVNGFTGLILLSFMVDSSPEAVSHELTHSRQGIRWTPPLFWLFYSTNMFDKRYDWEIQAYATQLNYCVDVLKLDYQFNLTRFATDIANDYDLPDSVNTAELAIANEYKTL